MTTLIYNDPAPPSPQDEAGGLGVLMADSGYGGIVLNRLAVQATEVLGTESSCIFVRDHEDPTKSLIAAACGRNAESVGRRVDASVERSPGLKTPGAAVELCWEGDVQGALAVSSETQRREFLPADWEVLRSLGAAAAAAVSHAHERRKLRPDVRQRIVSLAGVLEERDGYTAQHSREVVSTACTIGQAIGLDSAALAELEVAALLHDLGKIWVPDSILNKPGRLTADEHAVMAQHPVWGADALTNVPGLEAVATIVRYHHERWDGAGYPDRLAGGRIPIASRIIAVCDAYNAMTSRRPYRGALSIHRALDELKSGAGWQFDPGVVAQFERLLPLAEAV
jgi:HD-GYP domain-containing protein (c-di-GMP phosphodiesterase class II)